MSEAKAPLPLVELWDLQLGLSLIIARPSGVAFTNQVGGVACLHPSIEGVLIPLWVSRLPPDDPLEDYYESRLRPQDAEPAARRSVIRNWLEWADLLDVFEPVADTEVAEAWVPVRVVEKLSAHDLPLLGAFRGERGILTYENSD